MALNKGWLRRVLEGLTGRTFGEAIDNQMLHCRPLAVVREDNTVLFMGNADVKLVPDESGLMTASLEEAPDVPNIRVTERRSTRASSGLYEGGNPGGRDGLILIGYDESALEYKWRINGAAERLLSWQDMGISNDSVKHEES